MSELQIPPKELGAKSAAAVHLPDIAAMKNAVVKDGDSFFVGPALYLFVGGDATAEDGVYSIASATAQGRFRKITPKLRPR